MQQKTGIISDQRMLNHKSKTRHPQCPARLKAILKMLEQRNYLKHSEVDYVDKYDRLASDEEIGLAYPENYVKYINQLWPKDCKKTNIYASDSYINQHSEQIARMSTGGVLEAIDQIMKGNWRNGFSIIRPPGHHSGWNDKINGFCILNNIAIGAKYLQKQYSLKKIAILDYDIHRGDGTHHIFNQDPNVLFISIHRYDHGSFYPSGEDGNYDNCGAGKAEGTKVNIPLNYQTRKKKRYTFQAHGDNEYIYIYNRIIHPILEEFKPEFVLVSSGFDAARKDYLGGFTVTPNAYYYMTRKMLSLGKSMLCVLEGGYHLISTAQSVTAVIQALLSQAKLPEPIKNVSFDDIHEKCHLEKEYHSDIDDVIEFHSKYWKNLQKEQLVEYTKKIKENQKKVFGVTVEQESSSSSSQEEAVKSQEDEMQTTAQLYQQSKENTAQAPKQSIQPEPTFLNFSFAKGKVSKLANPKEQEFYSKDFPEKIFTPKYFGKEGNYLILENILFRQKYATVVNIILSKRSKNVKLSEQVREQQAKKQAKSTAMNLGFRVYGITTGNSQQEKLTISQLGTTKKILKEVINNTSKPIFLSFLSELSKKLKQAKRHYFGTSLFLVKGKDKSSIHWTNIYEWYDSNTHDQTLISGLDSLAKMIEEIERLFIMMR